MPNFVVTFDIHNYAERIDVVRELEEVLIELGIQKEYSNQTTHFGNHPYNGTRHFAYLLATTLNFRRISWDRKDIITVYSSRENRYGTTIAKKHIKYDRKERELYITEEV